MRTNTREGEGPQGQFTNRLFLVDTPGATDIHPFSTSDLERSGIAGHPANGVDWQVVVQNQLNAFFAYPENQVHLPPRCHRPSHVDGLGAP